MSYISIFLKYKLCKNLIEKVLQFLLILYKGAFPCIQQLQKKIYI